MDLNEFKRKFLHMAQKINLPIDLLPGFGQQTEEGRAYVEISEGISTVYRYVVKERGFELESKETCDIDEIQYWLFRDATLELASRRSKESPNPNFDPRRVLFSCQEELLGQINSEWEEKIIAEHLQLLTSAPYDDFTIKRVNYVKDLVKNGMSYEEANKVASKLYPRPF